MFAIVLCVSSLYAEEKTPQQWFSEARAAYETKDFGAATDHWQRVTGNW